MAKIKSDIEIARASKIKPISDILKKYNIPESLVGKFAFVALEPDKNN